MRESGAALEAKLEITRSLNVVDLDCGDGPNAIPTVKLVSIVLGVDIAKNLVVAGNIRSKYEELTNCTFQEGDASDLHELKSQTFDLVIGGIFGAMFAEKPFVLAREIVRVMRPGERIVLGNRPPLRSDQGSANIKDQLCILITTAGEFHWPEVVWSREQCY